MNSFLELVKQLTAIGPALLPVFAKQYSLLPFLNPQIAEDQWPVTALLAFCASAVSLNFAQRSQRQLPGWIAFSGLAAAVLSFLLMIAVVNGLIWSGQPSTQDFAVRAMFVLLFVGIGLSIGFAVSQAVKPA